MLSSFADGTEFDSTGLRVHRQPSIMAVTANRPFGSQSHGVAACVGVLLVGDCLISECFSQVWRLGLIVCLNGGMG